MNLVSELLESLNRPVQIVIGEIRLGKRIVAPHTWVLHEGFVVDISADQFNHLTETKFPEVLTLPVSKAKAHKAERCRQIKTP